MGHIALVNAAERIVRDLKGVEEEDKEKEERKKMWRRIES